MTLVLSERDGRDDDGGVTRGTVRSISSSGDGGRKASARKNPARVCRAAMMRNDEDPLYSKVEVDVGM